MFEIIKKLLKQKEKESVKFDELENWIDKKIEPIKDSLKQELNSLKQELKGEILETNDSLEVLKKAELRNKNIPPRELNFMEGSRDFYSKRIHQFIDNIRLPEEDIASWVLKTKEEINNLGKSTAKAYAILNHFFSDECYKIAQNIKKIDDLLGQLENLQKNKTLSAADKVKEMLSEFEKKVKIKQGLSKTMKELENAVSEKEKQHNEIIEKIEKKETSKEFNDYNSIKNKIRLVEENINSIKDEISCKFSVLEHALKKYSKISFENINLIKDYLEDSANAVIKDVELKIMDITRAIEKNIISGIIDLKDKKQEKTIEIVRSLSKEFLEDWKKRYHDLEKELDNLKNSLESFSIAHEILELKKQKSESEQEIEKTKQKKESNKLELSKIDLDKLKNEIKDNVKNIWDLEIY